MSNPKRVYIETYGCQMNVADSEIVSSIFHENGFALTQEIDRADIILLNTCSVRDNAEERVHHRLKHLRHYKKKNPKTIVGILGCMAERLRAELLNAAGIVDLVVGPDEYRMLPALVDGVYHGDKGLAVKLSRVETYDDITPLRTEGISAWLSVMRGCDKFCSFCVVPFTRGRERSRTLDSIVREVAELGRHGYKEVTLLGQNVNSYVDGGNDFASLLSRVAEADRSMRIRFMTSHPQDMSDRLIDAIASNSNICKYIHLPLQSGSNRILELMERNYTVEHYLRLVEKIRRAMPDVSLSTDIMAGFPTETDEDQRATLSAMTQIRFDGAYMFRYSPRENTRAWDVPDDVPDDVKGERLNDIVLQQQQISYENNVKLIGTVQEILVEGPSKKSDDEWQGRTDTNKVTVFPRASVRQGDSVKVKIHRTNSATLFGEIVDGQPARETNVQQITVTVR